GFARQPEERVAHARIHRARLAAVLRQCPWPVQLWAHDRPLRTAFFSADGKRVFTATEHGPVRGWDVETGEPVLELPAGKNEATRLSLGPDGLLAASGAGDDGRVVVYDSATGAAVGTPVKVWGVARHVALSPDGHRLLIGHADR